MATEGMAISECLSAGQPVKARSRCWGGWGDSVAQCVWKTRDGRAGDGSLGGQPPPPTPLASRPHPHTPLKSSRCFALPRPASPQPSSPQSFQSVSNIPNHTNYDRPASCHIAPSFTHAPDKPARLAPPRPCVCPLPCVCHPRCVRACVTPPWTRACWATRCRRRSTRRLPACATT